MHFLASPRRRRRLAWSVGATLALAGTVVLAIVFWNTATTVPTPVEDTPVRTDASPVSKPIAVTARARRDIRRTLERFVDAAVLRREVEQAWALTTPTLRGGVDRGDWNRGELPIQPYPWNELEGIDLRLLYSDSRSVALDVMLLPTDKTRPILVYTADVTPVGKGKQKRWLVDYWAPQASIGGGPPPQAAKQAAKQAAAKEREAAKDDNLIFDDSRLGAEWFLVPGAILFLLIGIPIGIAIKNTIAGRRAERRYQAELRG